MSSTLKLDWCSHGAARYAVEHWHYSRSLPNQKLVKVGAWEDGRFVGCVVFGDGANNRMFEPFGLDYTGGAELVRIALGAHQVPVSRVVRIALGFLKERCPRVRLVVSFADPEHGHIGNIYQAGNWVYTGMTEPADEYLINGVRMHGRALRSTRSTHRLGGLPARNVMEWAAQVLDPNIRRVEGSKKYRYLYPLDDAMRRQIEPLRKPYPKRAGSIEDAPADQAGEGGSQPTPALHQKVE